MAGNNFQNRVRVGGSGFTILTFGGHPIVFCQQVAHQSPQPVGGGVAAIQPMDEPYPIELITPAAAGMGTLVLNMFELFGANGESAKVWDRLGASIAGQSEVTPFGTFNPEEVEASGSTQVGIGGDGVFNKAVDIVDVFIRQAQASPDQLNVVKYIRPLAKAPGVPITPYTEEYMGCVITNIIDGEQIEVGTLEIIKQITIGYRYMKRNTRPSAAFRLRDNSLKTGS